MVWKLKTQQRVRVFMWELGHSRLLTNEAWWKRNLALNGDCGRCNGHLETCLHMVRDCSEAKEVWLKLLPPNFISKFFSIHLREWLEWNLLNAELKELFTNWARRVAICCWR